MNELKLFENEEFGKVRTIVENEKVWFVAKDICECLEIAWCGAKTISGITEKHKGVGNFPTPGGNQELLVVDESGLYKLILRSNKKEAEKFQDWICDEVLPSIRRHGIYATDNVIDKILNDPDFGIELLTTLKKERRARLEAERRNSILMHVNKTYTATEIAKELGMKSAIELNKKLTEKKIQYKQNNTWVMYSKYADREFEQIKQEVLDSGRVVYHRRFTQSGRDFILNLLSEKETETNVAV